MKYMLMIYAAADQQAGCTVEDWIAHEKEMRDAGVLVSGHSLADLVTATTVQVGQDGRRTVTDGPFAETREVLGGYYVIECRDLDEAVLWAGRCPSAQHGTVEVRPVWTR